MERGGQKMGKSCLVNCQKASFCTGGTAVPCTCYGAKKTNWCFLLTGVLSPPFNPFRHPLHSRTASPLIPFLPFRSPSALLRFIFWQRNWLQGRRTGRRNKRVFSPFPLPNSYTEEGGEGREVRPVISTRDLGNTWVSN